MLLDGSRARPGPILLAGLCLLALLLSASCSGDDDISSNGQGVTSTASAGAGTSLTSTTGPGGEGPTTSAAGAQPSAPALLAGALAWLNEAPVRAEMGGTTVDPHVRLYGSGRLPVRLEIMDDQPFSYSPMIFDGQSYFFGTRGRASAPWFGATERELIALLNRPESADIGEMVLWFWVLDPLTQLGAMSPEEEALSRPGGGWLLRGRVSGEKLLAAYPAPDPGLLEEWSQAEWPAELELDENAAPVVSRVTIFPGSSEEFVLEGRWSRASQPPRVPDDWAPLEESLEPTG